MVSNNGILQRLQSSFQIHRYSPLDMILDSRLYRSLAALESNNLQGDRYHSPVVSVQSYLAYLSILSILAALAIMIRTMTRCLRREYHLNIIRHDYITSGKLLSTSIIHLISSHSSLADSSDSAAIGCRGAPP